MSSEQLSAAVRDYMQCSGQTLSILESVTGGLVAHELTNVPGSGYLLGGGVCYDRGIKERFGVSPRLIDRCGVVSPEVAEALAKSAANWFQTSQGMGVTGAAGPKPEADGTEPGLAYVAVWSLAFGSRVERVAVDAARGRVATKQAIAEQAIAVLLHYQRGDR
jgi:PncC family amidohydrolase